MDASEALAAYEAAREAYDAAVADRDAKQAAYEGAQSELASLRSRLDANETKLDAASAMLEEKQRASEAAESVLRSARDAYAVAVEAATGRAPDELESAGAEAEAQAQKAIDEAEAAYTAAKADEDACQQVIDEAPAKISALEQQIADEEAKVDTAEDALKAATDDVTKADAAVKDAEQDLKDLEAAQKEWEEKAKPLQEAVDEAQQDVDEATEAKNAADKEVERINGEIGKVEQQIDDLKAQSGEVQTQAVDDLLDFMAWLRKKTYNENTNSSACSAALGFLAYAVEGGGWGANPSGNIEDYTHIGDTSDATYIDNVLAALNMIDQLNAIREAENLDPLKVSLAAMVQAAYNANWSAETGTIGHASQHGYPSQWGSGMTGENAAWGYTAEDTINPNSFKGDFFTGWYYQEKANYLKQDVTDPSSGKVYHPEEGGQTGHYLNIIRDNWNYTGMAYTNSGSYGSTGVNVFSSGNSLANRSTADKTYTTEQLRDLIDQAKAEGVQKYELRNGRIVYVESTADNSAQIAALEEQLSGLRTQLSEAQKTAATAASTLGTAQGNLKTAQTNLAAIGERPTDESLQQAYDEALAAYQQALKDESDAEGKLEQVKKDVADEVGKLEAQQTALQAQFDQAEKDIAGLEQATADALSDLEEAERNNKAVINAGEAYRTAKANAEAARAAEAEAQATVDALNKAIAGLEGDIAEVERAVDAAWAAYDSSVRAAAASLEELERAREAYEAALLSSGSTMWRLYNPWTGEHFYTADTAERDSLVVVGWNDEGVGWVAPASGDPVYRLYNPYVVGGDHHYTLSEGERDSLVSVGWRSEGVGWYSAPAELGVPLYRQYNPYAATGTHNYTADEVERDQLISVGWRDEGIAWNGVGDSSAAPVPNPDPDPEPSPDSDIDPTPDPDPDPEPDPDPDPEPPHVHEWVDSEVVATYRTIHYEQTGEIQEVLDHLDYYRICSCGYRELYDTKYY